MKARHKYSIGEVVYDKHQDEFVAVMQKRVENGHLCYRLSNEGIRHENFLIPLIMETPEQYTVKTPEEILKQRGLPISKVCDINGEYSTVDAMREYSSELTSELKELKEQNRILKELNGGKLLAYDQMKENLEMYAVRLSEKDEEITRLKGTLGVEAVRQNLELKERHTKIMADLEEALTYHHIENIRSSIKRTISKHQPIKKDEHTEKS